MFGTQRRSWILGDSFCDTKRLIKEGFSDLESNLLAEGQFKWHAA